MRAIGNDLISREYVEKIIISECVDLHDGTEEWRTYVNDTCENILNKVHNAPTVDTDLSKYSDKLWKEAYERGKNERPQGKWIRQAESKTIFFCSNCGREINTSPFTRTDNFPFCHCGADMREADNEQTTD